MLGFPQQSGRSHHSPFCCLLCRDSRSRLAEHSSLEPLAGLPADDKSEPPGTPKSAVSASARSMYSVSLEDAGIDLPALPDLPDLPNMAPTTAAPEQLHAIPSLPAELLEASREAGAIAAISDWQVSVQQSHQCSNFHTPPYFVV